MARARVVPDVNVFISGLLWTGQPHQIIKLAEAGEAVLVTTPSIVSEVGEALARRKFAARIATLGTSVGELIESLPLSRHGYLWKPGRRADRGARTNGFNRCVFRSIPITGSGRL